MHNERPACASHSALHPGALAAQTATLNGVTAVATVRQVASSRRRLVTRWASLRISASTS
jgi:hypothetical protein